MNHLNAVEVRSVARRPTTHAVPITSEPMPSMVVDAPQPNHIIASASSQGALAIGQPRSPACVR